MPCSHRRLQSTRNPCWPGHKQALGKDGRRGKGLSLESLGNRQSGCATVCPPVPSPALLSPAIILVGPSPDFRMTLPTPPSYPHPPSTLPRPKTLQHSYLPQGHLAESLATLHKMPAGPTTSSQTSLPGILGYPQLRPAWELKLSHPSVMPYSKGNHVPLGHLLTAPTQHTFDSF